MDGSGFIFHFALKGEKIPEKIGAQSFPDWQIQSKRGEGQNLLKDRQENYWGTKNPPPDGETSLDISK
jgi:hypothetical protein